MLRLLQILRRTPVRIYFVGTRNIFFDTAANGVPMCCDSGVTIPTLGGGSGVYQGEALEGGSLGGLPHPLPKIGQKLNNL